MLSNIDQSYIHVFVYSILRAHCHLSTIRSANDIFSHGLLCKTWIVPPLDRYWFICIYIYLFICLFIYLFSALTFFSKRYASHICWPILMKFVYVIFGVLGVSKATNMCLYCLYKQSYAYFYFPIQTLYGWTCDYDVQIYTPFYSLN